MAYVLTETAAGYALLKAADKKIYKLATLVEDLNSAEKVAEQFKIHRFEKFQLAANALEEANAVIEGRVSDNLKKLLEDVKLEKKATLVVSEAKLGNAINKLGLNYSVVSDAASLDLHRSIREFTRLGRRCVEANVARVGPFHWQTQVEV